MKSVIQLVEERDLALKDAADIVEAAESEDPPRPLEEAEEHRFNLATDKAAALNKQIEQRQKYEKAAAPTFTTPQQQGTKEDPTAALPNDDVRPAAAAAPELTQPRIQIPRSYGKLMSFPKTPDGEFRAYKVGKWLQAVIYNNHAAKQWCIENGVGIRADLAGGSNVAGGALVPEEMERAVIDQRELHGVFRRAVRVVPMGSDTRSYPVKTGQLTGYWKGEAAALTSSSQQFTNVELVAKKLTCLTLMSSEIEEDAVIDLADMTATDMAWAFAFSEDSAGFNGDGTSTYGGIHGIFVKALTAPHSTYATQAAVTAAHDTFAEIDGDDLLTVMGKVAQYAKPGCAWFCGPTALELVFNALKIAGGGNTVAILEAGQQPRFLGYPIYVSTVLPDSATQDYTSLAMLGFGNLMQSSLMGSRRGIRIQMSTERYFDTDQIGIKATERIDIVNHSLGTASVKSPFVVLLGGSG